MHSILKLDIKLMQEQGFNNMHVCSKKTKLKRLWSQSEVLSAIR